MKLGEKVLGEKYYRQEKEPGSSPVNLALF
jgi:hypothetical protein